MLVTALFLASPLHAAPKQADIEAYRALVQQDLRLASIGYRLARANASFCKNAEYASGLVLHNIGQYPDHETARAAFGFSQQVSIAAIVPGSPADTAKLAAGDRLVALSGDKLDLGDITADRPSYARLASVKNMIWSALNFNAGRKAGSIGIEIERDSKTISITLTGALACPSDYQIDTSGGINAGANGKMVSVSLGLARYAANDEELAAVVAHELSHNILKHRARLDALKVKRGIGRLFGKSKKAIRATEVEADQLSVWLMANAGYDPRAAIRFWKRHGREHGKGIFTEGTHYRWKKRVKIMQAEIDRIEALPPASKPLTPPLLAEK